MHAFYLGSILGVVLAVGDFREGGIPRDVEGDGVGKRRKGIAVYLWKKKNVPIIRYFGHVFAAIRIQHFFQCGFG
jgi:hypothetical protein